MSKENSRYHFLVYNASVLYWQFCRPFLKPNYRQYLARSLHQVVKALDDIDDQVRDFKYLNLIMIANLLYFGSEKVQFLNIVHIPCTMIEKQTILTEVATFYFEFIQVFYFHTNVFHLRKKEKYLVIHVCNSVEVWSILGVYTICLFANSISVHLPFICDTYKTSIIVLFHVFVLFVLVVR